MIELSRDDLRAIIAETRFAPSVHNIQPSRWHQAQDGTIELIGDPARSIPIADPHWRDWRLSHGAALEGLSMALADRSLGIAAIALKAETPLSSASPKLTIARVTLTAVESRAAPQPTATRVSWRGAFQKVDQETNASLDRLTVSRDDMVLVRGAAAMADVAALGDKAGLFFLRDTAHRRELVKWLRLNRSHQHYDRDGLNADAMSLRPIEAWGAGLVLGPLFASLDRVGLAAPLVSERDKTASAAATVLFHRPDGEDPFESGRAFYRAWLAFEREGLKGCPVSVLADWPIARDALAVKYAIPKGRRIVSVFRIGRPTGAPVIAHARLSVDELLS
jgi:nitroreductase